MKLRTALIAAVASLTMTAAANAVPLAAGSQVSFSDGASYSSTAITFSNGGLANMTAGAATGSFSAFSAGCIGCASFSNFTFSPFVAPKTVYTATANGVTTAFTLNSLTSSSVTALTLNLAGTGTVTLTGFDPTPGIFLLSSQGPQGTNVTFSATTLATAVPEPMSLFLLGAGLVGMGGLRMRRKS